MNKQNGLVAVKHRETMSSKTWIRVAVLAGILAWPGVETYRYGVALGQRNAALQRQQRVALMLSQTRAAHQAREARGETATPVATPETRSSRSSASF